MPGNSRQQVAGCAGSVLPCRGDHQHPSCSSIAGAARWALCKASGRRASRPFNALGPWRDSGRAPWAEFRVTLGSSTARAPASLRWTRLPSALPASEFPRRQAPASAPSPLSRVPREGAWDPPSPHPASLPPACPPGRLRRSPSRGGGGARRASGSAYTPHLRRPGEARRRR